MHLPLPDSQYIIPQVKCETVNLYILVTGLEHGSMARISTGEAVKYF